MMHHDDRAEACQATEVWITGIGLVSSLADGADEHWNMLFEGQHRPVIDEAGYSPYPVHPLCEVDFASQVKRKSDLRQMGQWQRIGVYAAGLALTDAGIADQIELLQRTHLVVAAGNGERDETADCSILAALSKADSSDEKGELLNRLLQTSLRPTLYLAELSNLMAGNISIVHGVSASSRTFKGEEMAGVSAVEDAFGRLSSGQGQVFLVGGAFNAERADLALVFELCGALWQKPFRPVLRRADGGGGFVMGSLGAFLVLESAEHARIRGRKPYAIISMVKSVAGTDSQPENGRSAADTEDLLSAIPPRLQGPVAVLSGASGVEPATRDEIRWLDRLAERGIAPQLRAFGSVLGHSVEAHFPAGLALAALAISKRKLYPPFGDGEHEEAASGNLNHALVTGWGHWRGAGLAVLEAATPL